ncbi:hypothetical protein SH661x_001938 [Planctomicrobium sp. SH661]|uniref:hypothetical protein n=1 Tax=Planctomicrobium sp. SH661 TaxID=3448124 RepID=UPI003F5BB4CB
MIVRTALLLLVLFVLLWVYTTSPVPEQVSRPNVEAETQMAVEREFTADLSNPDRWQSWLRMRTVDIDPTYVTCDVYTMLDDSFTVLLTNAGRDLWEDPDDVQQAISDAVAQAIDSLISGHFSGEGSTAIICPDSLWPCAITDGTGSATENDASVSAELVFDIGESPYESPYSDMCGDPSADPSTLPPENRMRKELKLSITAPRKPGVNLREFVESINLDNIPSGVSSTDRDAMIYAVNYLKTQNLVLPLQSSGGSYFVSAIFDGVIIEVAESGGSGGARIAYEGRQIDCSYASVSGTGTWSPLMMSSKTADEFVVGGFDFFDASPGMFPDILALELIPDNSDLTITPTIPLTNNGTPSTEHWQLYSTYAPSSDSRFTSTGYLHCAYDTVTTMTDPGFRTACRWDVLYRNIEKIRYDCWNLFELDVLGIDGSGFVHPPGKFPKCRIPLYIPSPPPGLTL